MTSSQTSASHPTAIYDQLLDEQCSETSLIAPGYIQPHGVLLVLQAPQLTIRQLSANAPSWLGRPTADLLDHSLEQVLSATQYQRVLHHLNQVYAGLGTPFELRLKAGNEATPHSQRRSFRCQLHAIADGVLLEMEPLQSRPQFSGMSLYHRLQAAIVELRQSHSLDDLAQRLTHTVANLTGFDRVMVYQFQADDHGVVIAETKRPEIESYLGLHYPAFDIPKPSRQLFLRNWVRLIPHVQAPAVELVPADVEAPVDLSDAVLRGVSPYHIEYLQNMGVAATMTLSLITEQRLWGLIACHHYEPKAVDHEVRKTCELLGQLASIELMHQQSRELNHYQQQVKVIQADLQQAFLETPNFIETVLTSHGSQLLELVHAQGAAILIDDQLTLMGITPSEAEVRSLVDWLVEQRTDDHLFATHQLAHQYPPANRYQAQASGLLAVSICLGSDAQRSYHLLWFRPEQIQTVNWAGNPQTALQRDDELGQLKLCPRHSFMLWQEIVQGQALPWQPVELAAAQEMYNTLMLAVLEFSQAALVAEAERAAVANQAKSQFLAKMSHELRTPLNAILGFTQVMLRDDSVPHDLRDSLDIIGRSGEHLLTLINDVLEMSKIEAGQLEVNRSCFSLSDLLQSMHQLFALKAAEKGVHFTFDLPAKAPQYICTDQAKLRQILINLLSNAIKFTDHGQIRLSVTWSLEPDLAHPPEPIPLALALAVTDTGCGILPDEQATIFEAFRQTQQGRDFQGTGLGLAISRQFARLLGGDITLRSTEAGSTFTCHIVVHPATAIVLDPQPRPQYIEALAPDQPTYGILIAEDTFANRLLLQRLLTNLGFEVRTAEHGKDAVQQWQTWHPALILMDIQMPQLDGLAATRQIRQAEAQQQRSPTPIIALTAYAFESDRDQCLAAGCNDYLAKPFAPEVLFEKIAGQLQVRYRYQEPSALALPDPAMFQPLRRQDLARLPAAWRHAACEAALDLDDAILHQLVQQISPDHPAIGTKLTQLLDNFQFDEIALLTGPQAEEQP
jgi:light-regulated signal transduction histidine kinase (bacteriophytochrome)/DNA-binding response OmpR family regulator